MKIIHCADLHLDSSMSSYLSNEKAKERKAELLLSFEKMVDYAVREMVDAIIIAGDLFDVKNVSATARNTVLRKITDNSDITFFYLRGNHDNDNFLSSLEEIPANLKLFKDSYTAYRMGHDGNIVISGIELNKSNNNTIYALPQMDISDFNIFVLHGQESSALIKDRAENISIKDLRGKGIDYLALGHIHSYSEGRIDDRGIYVYPGCLEGRGFDECGDKGFVLLDINEGKMTFDHTFIPFSNRRLHEIKVDVSECMNSTEVKDNVNKAICNAVVPAKDLIKIVLVGEQNIGAECDLTYVTKQFEDYFYYFRVKDKTGCRVDYDTFKHDESLKGEFVRTVMKRNDLSDEDKAMIIRYGIKTLMGEKDLIQDID